MRYLSGALDLLCSSPVRSAEIVVWSSDTTQHSKGPLAIRGHVTLTLASCLVVDPLPRWDCSVGKLAKHRHSTHRGQRKRSKSASL